LATPFGSFFGPGISRLLIGAAIMMGAAGPAIALEAGPYTPAIGMNINMLTTWGPSPRGDSLGHKENERLVASGLAILLGPFGAHRLYLGTTAKVAVIYGITLGGFGILAVIDLGHILFTKDLSRYHGSDRVFMWAKPKSVLTPP
jgi:TM2 domain-containing membrane protein YozV